MTVALRCRVGRALAAVVGRFTGQIKPRDGCAILPDSNRVCSEKLRIRRMQNPRQQQAVYGKGSHPQPALPSRGSGIQLRKHILPQRHAMQLAVND